MTCAKICKNCSFFDEIAPKEHIDENYDLGLCTIGRDRLPLWIKDCGCDTFAHGDWADCPMWTAGVDFVEEGPILAVVDIECEPIAVQIAARWLPVGNVIWGNGIIADQFSAVLDFAERHAGLINSDDLHMAQDYGRLFLGQQGDQDAEALGKLFDALNRACPPFTFFGSHPGNSSDIGVWPDDEGVEEAIQEMKMVRIDNWLDIDNVSPTYEYTLVDGGGRTELYHRNKGVKSMVWKLR